MAALTSIATIAALALAAGTTAYQVKSSNDARDATQEETDKQMAAQAAQDKERQTLEADAQKKAGNLKMRNSARRGGGGRSDTILTAGLLDAAPGAAMGKEKIGQ